MHASTRPDEAVGIDLGVKTLAVMADSVGEIREVASPKHLEHRMGGSAWQCGARHVFG
ncbi:MULTISPECIES: hypothetical protein [unclassified Streptomyces]|uniref:hypothetical protein n=1 Tax=unclassified Streptomyces TaxID=2593676 RepID=UPI00386733B4|nr:transposase [Streptomyces sp. NBC_01017]WSV34870.1 transposase [Streptomyces sp. NBC_01017]